MEYIYAAMLIHKAGKKVDENNVKKVLEAAGVAPDDARVRALVAALDGVNIDEAIQKAAVAQVTVAAAPSHEEKKEEKKTEKIDEKKDDEDAAAGLGALFG
ncbi:50S ribosomal protein P1 [Candidatus Woesearchaeota archaeon]|nr:50S ribosomal protein P1 [Candidatus Woesearchaeota archaeon]